MVNGADVVLELPRVQLDRLRLRRADRADGAGIGGPRGPVAAASDICPVMAIHPLIRTTRTRAPVVSTNGASIS